MDTIDMAEAARQYGRLLGSPQTQMQMQPVVGGANPQNAAALQASGDAPMPAPSGPQPMNAQPMMRPAQPALGGQPTVIPGAAPNPAQAQAAAYQAYAQDAINRGIRPVSVGAFMSQRLR